MTEPTPITGNACTAAILLEALNGVDPDTVVVLQIPGYPWMWRIGDIRLTSFTEHHHVDEATIVLPAVYVVVEADQIFRRDMSVSQIDTPGENSPPAQNCAPVPNGTPGEGTGVPTDTSTHSQKRCRGETRTSARISGLLRRIFRRNT